jgi:hypothetical protein
MNTLVDLLKELANDANLEASATKYDFTKKEDIEKLKEKVKTLKEIDNPVFNFIKTMTGINFDETLDEVVCEAEKIYQDAHKDETKPVKEIAKPSNDMSDKMKGPIATLTTEYLNEVIIPNYKNITMEQATSIYNSLYEFACWIYKK